MDENKQRKTGRPMSFSPGQTLDLRIAFKEFLDVQAKRFNVSTVTVKRMLVPSGKDEEGQP